MTMLKLTCVEVAQLNAGRSIADTPIYSVWYMYGTLKKKEDEDVHELDCYGDKEHEVNVLYVTNKRRVRMFDFEVHRTRCIK